MINEIQHIGTIILILVYIIGLFSYASSHEIHKIEKEPKDIWIAIIWPIIFIWWFISSILASIHVIIGIALLALFIPYNKSRFYRRINDFLA